MPLVVLLVLTAEARADAPACVVAGSDVTLAKVLVRTGRHRLEVRVHDVAVVATARGRTTSVDVGGAIAFTGAVRQRVWYTVDRKLVDGGVTLARGAHIIGTRANGDVLVGSAVLYSNDVMQGEDKPADETVSAVRARCDRLTLDWIADDDDPEAADDGDDSELAMWRTRTGGALVLRRQPHPSAAAVTYRSSTCDGAGCLTVAGLERRGAWRKVAAINEGVTVEGWVRANRLTRVPDDEGFGHSYGCTGDHGDGIHDLFGPAHPPRTARIRVGTRIYAEPNAGAWATVQRDEEFEVVFKPGDHWAEVVRIPNVDLRTGSAYVLVSSLIMTST